ncbi:MAG TPA: oligosaccharide flippase family protein [Chloroflexi bacterium]|nr:oligosaccharide flippase family protein [Chloroflexota bacterium]
MSSSPGGQQTPIAFRAVRGGIWLLGSSYWTLAFGFVANIFLMRLLTPQIYGEFALGMFFYSLFQLRGKLGLNFAFAQQKAVTGETVGTLFTLDVLLGLGGLLLTLAATPFLLYFGYSQAVLIVAVAMAVLAFLESFLAVFGVVLEANLHFKPVSIISSVVMPISYVPAFLLAMGDGKQYSLLAQAAAFSILGQIVGLFYILHALRPLLRLHWQYRPALAVDYLRFGATTGIGNFIAGQVTQLDNFILGTLSGTTALGYYDRAYRIAQWPALLLNAVIGRAAVFTYSQLRDDHERLQRSSTMLLWISANVATPVALALFLSAPDLVLLLFGAQWLPVVPILRILLLVSVVRPLWENLGALFIGVGQPRRIIEVSLVQLAVLAVAGLLLAYTAGAAGMAMAVVLSAVVGLLVAYSMLRRLFQLPLWDTFAGPFLAAGLTLALYWGLVRVVGSELPLWLAVAWKVAWALLGFVLFSALVQPTQFRSRLAYILRLARKQAA